MDYYGLPWVVVGCYWFFCGLLVTIGDMGFNGLLWVAMVCDGLLWVSLGCFGLLWCALGCYGALRVAIASRAMGVMGFYRLLWVAMVSMGCYGSLGC